MNPPQKIPGRNADTAKVSTATASNPAAENESALSVPAAAGISEFGSTSPSTLTLPRSGNPAARRCSACGDIEDLNAPPLFEVDITEDELAEVCSIRCLLAMLVPEAERQQWLAAWERVKATRPPDEKDPSDPLALNQIADLELVGYIIAAEEAERIAKLPPPPPPQPPKQQPEKPEDKK